MRDAAALPEAGGPGDRAVAPCRAPFDIPLDHLGSYEVEVGEAGLPDGTLSTVSATLGEPNPATFWIAAGVGIDSATRSIRARPDVRQRSTATRFDGVERVKVFLVFDVTELKSPSVLQVRDLVVE